MADRVYGCMLTTAPLRPDSLSVALDLIERLGERSIVASKVRLVEMIAANDLGGAVFWRAVLRHCEARLGVHAPETAAANRNGSPAPAQAADALGRHRRAPMAETPSPQRTPLYRL